MTTRVRFCAQVRRDILHIGSARTATFQLSLRQNIQAEKFLLRVEDTDQQRFDRRNR